MDVTQQIEALPDLPEEPPEGASPAERRDYETRLLAAMTKRDALRLKGEQQSLALSPDQIRRLRAATRT